MSSTRLPGKVMKKIAGKTFLEYHIDRLHWSEVPVYVATTNNGSEKPICDLLDNLGIIYFKGDEDNVLERYYKFAKELGLEVIIRVTSDCPLVDGYLIKQGLEKYMSLGDPSVYYSNCLKRSFPRGMDFEIFSFNLLEEAYKKATLPQDIEHVTPFINNNRSGQVKIKDHCNATDSSNIRLTLDTKEDLFLLDHLITTYNAHELTLPRIVEVFKNNPHLLDINKHIIQKEI